MSEQNGTLRPRPKNIAERVRELLFPVVLEAECYLWDVEYVKEGDCERVTRAIDPILDEVDPIECSYRLEVTSPGVERPLTRPDHFEACIGDAVEVKLFAPLNGTKTLRGTLTGAEDKAFTITLADESEITIQKNAAAKVKTVFEW